MTLKVSLFLPKHGVVQDEHGNGLPDTEPPRE